MCIRFAHWLLSALSFQFQLKLKWRDNLFNICLKCGDHKYCAINLPFKAWLISVVFNGQVPQGNNSITSAWGNCHWNVPCYDEICYLPHEEEFNWESGWISELGESLNAKVTLDVVNIRSYHPGEMLASQKFTIIPRMCILSTYFGGIGHARKHNIFFLKAWNTFAYALFLLPWLLRIQLIKSMFIGAKEGSFLFLFWNIWMNVFFKNLQQLGEFMCDCFFSTFSYLPLFFFFSPRDSSQSKIIRFTLGQKKASRLALLPLWCKAWITLLARPVPPPQFACLRAQLSNVYPSVSNQTFASNHSRGNRFIISLFK